MVSSGVFPSASHNLGLCKVVTSITYIRNHEIYHKNTANWTDVKTVNKFDYS